MHGTGSSESSISAPQKYDLSKADFGLVEVEMLPVLHAICMLSIVDTRRNGHREAKHAFPIWRHCYKELDA